MWRQCGFAVGPSPRLDHGVVKEDQTIIGDISGAEKQIARLSLAANVRRDYLRVREYLHGVRVRWVQVFSVTEKLRAFK